MISDFTKKKEMYGCITIIVYYIFDTHYIFILLYYIYLYYISGNLMLKYISFLA